MPLEYTLRFVPSHFNWQDFLRNPVGSPETAVSIFSLSGESPPPPDPLETRLPAESQPPAIGQLLIRFQFAEAVAIRERQLAFAGVGGVLGGLGGLLERLIHSPEKVTIAEVVYEACAPAPQVGLMGRIPFAGAEIVARRALKLSPLPPWDFMRPGVDSSLRHLVEEAQRLYERHRVRVVLEYHGDIRSISPYLAIYMSGTSPR